MKRSGFASRITGLGLIELLAVIALVGLVSGVFLGRVGTWQPEDPSRTALNRALELDALARQSAPCLGPLVLAVSEGTLRLVRRESGQVLAARDLPELVALVLELTGQSARFSGEVTFGRFGSAPDYRLRIANSSTPGKGEKWIEVSGISGSIRELRP